MMLLTLIQVQIAKLISDQELFQFVVKAVIGFLSVLFSSLVGILLWIFKSILNQAKSYRIERAEETKEFHAKFSAINEYMNETDKVQMLHTESIEGIKSDTKDLMKKSQRHENLLTDHTAEIRNINKKID